MPDWKCSHCGQESSYQGHYVQLRPGDKACKVDGGYGFVCPPGHKCQPSTEERERREYERLKAKFA